jgi:hypothetical protein
MAATTRTIKLEFTYEEANTILENLGEMPFMRVYRIIEKIHEQASASALSKRPAIKAPAKPGKKRPERKSNPPLFE